MRFMSMIMVVICLFFLFLMIVSFIKPSMAIMTILFFFAMVVGLIKPSVVLWFMKTKTRGRVLLVYGLPFFFIGLINAELNTPPNSSFSPDYTVDQLEPQNRIHRIQERIQKQETAQRQENQGNIDYFNANRGQIISSVKKALLEKEYQSVISQSDKYLVSGAGELEQMNVQARKELDAIEKAEKTKKLLAELKGVPPEEYEKNRDLYQQLSGLHPDNKLYKSKVLFYAGKLQEITHLAWIQSYAMRKFENVTGSTVNWGGNLRKVRGVKASKISDKKYSLIIDFRINDNLGSWLRTRGIFSDIKDFAKAVSTDKAFEHIDKFFFQGFFPLMDKYGAANEESVVSASMTRNLIRKINWENMSSEDLMRLLSLEGNLKIHPAMD